MKNLALPCLPMANPVINRCVFYCSAGVKANFKHKKIKNSQRLKSKLTAFIRAKRSKMS